MPWLPPTQLPPVVEPTVTNVEDIYEPYIVPVIHPSHTQYNHHQIIQYQHHYPHTASQCCDVCYQHVKCGRPNHHW